MFDLHWTLPKYRSDDWSNGPIRLQYMPLYGRLFHTYSRTKIEPFLTMIWAKKCLWKINFYWGQLDFLPNQKIKQTWFFPRNVVSRITNTTTKNVNEYLCANEYNWYIILMKQLSKTIFLGTSGDIAINSDGE